ncbi:MAG: AMP-binding protein [Chloroflexota bacterium]
MNIRAFWESRVAEHPDKTFIYYKDEKVSYLDFERRVNRVANVFLRLGVKKGDRVSLMLSNSPEFLYSWFALAKIGAVMVPVNNRFKVNEARYIVSHSESTGLVVHSDYLEIATALKESCPSLKWLVCVDGKKMPTGVMAFDELVRDMPDNLKGFELDDDDLAAVIYTSGTTGFPKGAMHVQRSFVLAGEAFTLAADLRPEDRLMVVLPLYHVNAQFYSVMGAVVVGASIVLIRDFSVSRFWEQAVGYGVTQFNFIGAVGRMLMARPESEFRPEHKIRVANGAGISPQDYEVLTKRFKIRHVIDGYGLTECPRVSQNPIGGLIKMNSIGLPAKHPDPKLKFAEMKIVDDNGKEVATGTIGELIVRSPVLMKGYFRDMEKTEEAIKDGWFYTGDYAYKDEEGYFYFVDRKKDIIRRRGENISAREVELAISENPKVVESAVIPVPSALGEDEVMAFLVLRQGEVMSSEEVVLWCKDRLANFKVPRYIQFRPELPKTATQRTQKNLLREEKGLIQKAYDMEAFKKSLGI